MYKRIKPLLFRFDPERIHKATLLLMEFVGAARPVNWAMSKFYSGPESRVDAFGLSFKNPLGLAAGYDKDGSSIRGLASLGFGHIEIGTVTMRPQSGNPKPRLFRLPEDQALINRLGFPSRGVEFVHRNIQRNRLNDVMIGVNIGKNKDTPLEEAPGEYLNLLKHFYPIADYVVINISSPNTIGLRRLQARDALNDLLSTIDIERKMLPQRKSVLVKIAPDLNEGELSDALEAILNNDMDGVIATNTTISRNGLRSPHASESGGLSGVPLHAMSVDMVRRIHRLTSGKLPIIGAGGVFNSDSAQRMLDAGAVLVQIYTGLVFEGPYLVKNILNGLS